MGNYNKSELRKIVKSMLATPYVPPKPSKQPKLSDYGLSEVLITEDKHNEEVFKKKQKIIFFSLFIIILSCIYYVVWGEGGVNGIVNIIITSLYVPLGISMPLAAFTIFREYKSDTTEKLKKFKEDTNNWVWWTELYPKKKVKAYWYQLDGYSFEKELAEVFSAKQYKVSLTTKSGDGGVDIILNKNNTTTYVQCKAHKSKIGVAVVRELYGVMQNDNVKSGIIASLNGFTSGAVEFANGKNITLISVEDIINMINE